MNSGKLFVECSRSMAARQSPRCTRSFQSGIRLPSGQPVWQNGTPQSMQRCACSRTRPLLGLRLLLGVVAQPLLDRAGTAARGGAAAGTRAGQSPATARPSSRSARSASTRRRSFGITFTKRGQRRVPVGQQARARPRLSVRRRVALDEIAQQRDVDRVGDRLEADHLVVDARAERPVAVEHEGRCRRSCRPRSCDRSGRAPRRRRRSCTRSRGRRRPRPRRSRRSCARRSARRPGRGRRPRRRSLRTARRCRPRRCPRARSRCVCGGRTITRPPERPLPT